jgi:hypothetical protein
MATAGVVSGAGYIVGVLGCLKACPEFGGGRLQKQTHTVIHQTNQNTVYDNSMHQKNAQTKHPHQPIYAAVDAQHYAPQLQGILEPDIKR